jgi:hypothetical protein
VRDVDLKPAEIARYHLICWGDPHSNSILRKVANQIPIGWADEKLVAAGITYDPRTHVPLEICPNPLNREKYLVINSGPTHREAHDRTNSLQNPKLGDYAIIDVTQSPTADSPGQIIRAGCFDEYWKLSEKVSPSEKSVEISAEEAD